MVGRAPNGSSSIYLGKDGRWHTWVHAGQKENGKPDRRHIKRRTAGEVKVAAELLRERLARGQRKVGKAETVEQWLVHWLEHIIKPRRAWKTYTAYRALIYGYVVPSIGAWKLDGTRNRLEPEYVEAMYTKMASTKIVRGSRKAGPAPTLSGATIHKTHRMLNVAFKAAVRRGRASRNVCAIIDPPTYRKKKVAALTLGETEAVVQAALEDDQAARWLTGLLLGPRQGETLAIRWFRVVLDPGVGDEPHLKLTKQLQRRPYEHGCDEAAKCAEGRHRTKPCLPPWKHGCADPAACRPRPHLCPLRRPGAGCGRHTRSCPPLCKPGCAEHARHCPQRLGGIEEVDLKTEKSERDLVLPAVLVELLRRLRERQQREFAAFGLTWTPQELIFTTRTGKPIDAGRDHKAWEDLLRRAGVADAKLHAARHTAGTMLVASGTDISVVQDILGHTQIATARIYVDVAQKTKREAVDRAVSALMDGNLAALLQPNAATQGPPG